MDINKIIKSLIGVFLLFVVVFSIFNFFFQKEEILLEEIDSSEIEISPDQIPNITAEIIASRNYEGCNQIPDDLYQNVCKNNIGYELALEMGDSTQCEKLDDNLLSIDFCKFEVAMLYGINDSSSYRCDTIINSTLRSDCEIGWNYMKLVETGDKKYCVLEEEECLDIILLDEYEIDPINFDCNEFITNGTITSCQDLKEFTFEDVIANQNFCFHESDNIDMCERYVEYLIKEN